MSASAIAPPPLPPYGPAQPPMERVLFGLHQQLCVQALRRSSARTRSALEHLLLVLAVGCFGLLLLAHLNFVHGRTAAAAAAAGQGSPWSSQQKLRIPATCLAVVPGFDRGCDVTHLSIWGDSTGIEHQHDLFDKSSDRPEDDGSHLSQRQQSFVYIERPGEDDNGKETCRESPFRNMTVAPKPVFSFSHTKGLLLLPHDALRELNRTVQHVFVSTRDVHCFGEPFLQHIVHRLTGPETVAMNWILGLSSLSTTWSHLNDPKQRPVLFVYNPRTDFIIDLQEQFSATHSAHPDADHRHSRYYGYGAAPARPSPHYYYYYNHYPAPFPWPAPLIAKLAVVVKTSFLFFITTTLIAFTLRETQGRMLDFTHQLQAQVRLRQSVSRLVVAHVLENLVFVPQTIGLCFFLTEFYKGDRFLAFVVLSLVWLCEVFSVISLRTAQGMHFFPRIFFLLFSLYHFYLFSFPFGFSYMALASTVLFMAHSVLFFWHRYELPAVAHGHVSLHHPRMATAAMTPPTSLHGAQYFATPNQQPIPDSIPMLSSADRRVHSTRSAAEVQPPNFNLSPRHVQQQPQTTLHHGSQVVTSASISGSRQASSSVLFHPGSVDEDERDESYLFFMNGEVVVHRRPPSTASLRSGISSIHNDDNLSSGEDNRGVDPISNRIDSFGGASHEGEADSVGFMSDVADVLETSALQAIMEINNSRNHDDSRDDLSGTPRADNLTRGVGEDGETTGNPQPATPDFPNFQDASSPVNED